MTEPIDPVDPSDDAIRRIDPVPRERLGTPALRSAREDLWEDIMATNRPHDSERSTRPLSSEQPGRGPRRWLVPAAAAAAVAVVAGGAYALVLGGDDAGDRAAGPSSSATASATSSAPTSASASVTPSASASASAPVVESYAMPPRPLLLTAPGWRPDVVDGFDVTWSGPGGAEVEVRFFTYGQDEDPFAYGDYPRGTEIRVLEERTRLTTSTEDGAEHRIAVTAPVIDVDGTAVLFESATLDRAAFQRVLGSARWVDLGRYDRVVQPAVG